MIPEKAVSQLRNILKPECLLTGQNDLEDYSTDSTKLKYLPEAVAFPSTDEEISEILRLANKFCFPVVPRGAGSGKTGGALPVKGGLVLVMDRFNRILEIDRENLIAKAEPFVITAHLQEEVEKAGLFYPPDPASTDVSTLGGNVAENAGGLRGLKYGVTGDYVLGLKVVLPTGEIIKTGVETVKGVAGYDLTSLIVGSEGTLAVVTSITLKLLPKPETKKTMAACFSDMITAAKTVSNIIRHRILPATLEFIDRPSIDCVRSQIEIKLPENTGAVLLIEVDGDRELVEREAYRIKRICDENGVIDFKLASDEKEVDLLWDARRKISPSLLELKPGKISEDIVVPRSRIPELIAFLGVLSEKYNLPVPAYGHAGDGNIHVNILLDREIPEEVSKGGKIVKELFRKVISLGGTITGEHGIGITKAPYMEMEFSKPAIELMKRLKNAFDPNNILNPGKIL